VTRALAFRSTRVLGTAVLAAAVGIGVAYVARRVAGGACPPYETLGRTSCGDLVGSLAARIGVAAAVAVVIMELLSTGLLKTWKAMEDERREAGADRA
jgi:hypothetical protein